MSFLWCQTMSSMIHMCTLRLFSTLRELKVASVKLSCACGFYELWALWVLSFYLGVTVLCRSDSECFEFYDCSFLDIL